MTELNFIHELIIRIANDLKIKIDQVTKVLELLSDNNTVPFIARYRKEVTGALNEEQIREISKEYEYQQNLLKRKDDVIRLISEKGKLTDELKNKILVCDKLSDIEDLYRPYKEKKKTRATDAIAKGLEPLAQFLLSFPKDADVLEEASKYLDEEKGVNETSQALQGAQDIIAEMVSDNADIRKFTKGVFVKEGQLTTKVKDESLDERKVYEMYYDYHEPINKIVSHRILAVNRGDNEKIIRVSIDEPKDKIMNFIYNRMIVNDQSVTTSYVLAACDDGYKRLIKPSIEREIRSELKEKAEGQAINIFSENLRNLLLQPPMKGKMVLGVDPAYRTGCKFAVVDETGKMLTKGVIYPHEKYKGEKIHDNRVKEAQDLISKCINDYQIEIVAIGNGTASRETEEFIVNVLSNLKRDVSYIIVSEAGASVYSASELARKEFPDLNVEERSAISIARRLQDPLSELVKIDTKSIGVGQYQHDVTQSKLKDSLNFVVETTVNHVGVNVNTASEALLKHVSGCNATVAKNIVKYRDDSGKFTNRKELIKVPRFGAKSYEQAIGFLRIVDGNQPLDKTGIHPENYDNALLILKHLGCELTDLGTDKLVDAINQADKAQIMHITNLGEHTLNDILDAFIAPNRDPRDELAKPLLRKGIKKLEDLQIGMELQGTVRNVVDFGAFVDCGVKEGGLVHISKMSNAFVKHPMDVVNVGDIVTVYVENIDLLRRRLALTMIKPE
ncbi:RNA-binding transcriptional accessory protein [Mycoplasmatota bacterium]|nr:RNA-binding transcriptional accessory protein [Mycoplasmatota bacterium]